jgi:TRAP-type C4-dicarboxylate transport system permease small subunit
LVDRFSPRVQKIFDGIAQILTIAVTMLISYVFFTVSMETTETTLLLDFPYTVLKFIVGIGFLAWGFVALVQIPFKATEPSLNNRVESKKGTLPSESLTYHSEKEVKLDV